MSIQVARMSGDRAVEQPEVLTFIRYRNERIP
jgi:hypothetical protein